MIIMLLVILPMIIYIGRTLNSNLVKDNRNNKYGRILSKIIIFSTFIFLFQYGINSFNGNRLPIGNKIAEEYTINFNQTKESNSGTKVTVNDVLLDMNSINLNLGVKGEDKVVAVEIKKDPADEEALMEFTGLYIGKKTMYQYNGLSMSIKGDEFLEKLYIICYLSNGEDLRFKVEDVNNVKSHVKVHKLDRKLKEDPQLILNKVTKGVSYTSIDMTSDINFFDLEVTVLDGEEEYTKLSGVGSGGLFQYSSPPVKTKDVKIKVKIKSSGEEIIIPVEL